MPDWVDLGFDIVAAGQRAAMNQKLDEMGVNAKVASVAELRNQRENFGRQMIFEAGEGLKKLKDNSTYSPESIYAVTTMLHLVFTGVGINPAFFSQIADKERVAEIQNNLDSIRESAAHALSPTQIEEADRFAKISFSIASLIQVEQRQETIRNAEAGMQRLGKNRQLWNIVIILSAIGIFVIPFLLLMASPLLASIDKSGSLLCAGSCGLPCLAVIVAIIGVVIGLIGKSAATPKEWNGLKQIKENFTNLLPTPQNIDDLYRDAEITPAEYLKAKDDFIKYRDRLELTKIPNLPVVSETLTIDLQTKTDKEESLTQSIDQIKNNYITLNNIPQETKSPTIAKQMPTKDPHDIICSNCKFEQWSGYRECQKCGAHFQ